MLRAAIGLHRLLRGLADRVIPADLVAFDLAIGTARTAMMGALVSLGIPDLLDDGAQTGAELAARVGTDADATHRVLRALAWDGVLRLDRQGRFHHTRVSRALRSGQLTRTREWVRYFASTSNQRAYQAFEHVIRTGRNGFAHGNGQGVWAWFDEHPAEREQFAQVMMGLTVRTAPLVATRYPWRDVAIVCDVGGGRGTLLSELLVRHRHLRGVLCDREGVLAAAGPLLRARGVADRVELVAGSFFGDLPRGADVYVLKNVLHDWDDERSAQILARVRAAMTAGQRVLIVESLIERDQVDLIAFADVHMMTVCDEGRERSRAELARLLVAAGFRPGRVERSPTVAIVEGVAT